MLSLKQCIERLKEVYPDMYPTHYVGCNGKYIFNIVQRGVNRDQCNADFHLVDPETGGVSGSIPMQLILQNKELVELLKHPHSVDPEDQKLEHSVKIRNSVNAHYTQNMDRIFLEHHGIKGQKWGVRRFQNEDGTLTSAGKERYRKNGVAAGPDGAIDPLTAYYIAEFASIALFSLGASIYAKVKRNQNHKNWKKQNDAISEDYISDIADLKEFSENSKPNLIKGDHSREDDMTAINPTRDQSVKGNTSNCVLCSVAYDFRRRGYDVTSKLCTTGMYTDKVVKDMYENVKEDKVGGRNWTAVYRNCEKKYPEGSRGVISVSSIFGGHAMAFEIQNGKMEIYDAQSAVKRKLTDDELAFFVPSYTTAYRLDDKKIKWDGANIACAELKSDWKKTTKAKQKKEETLKVTVEVKEKQEKKAAAGSKSVMNMRQIMAYKREHPNSKLTDKEIWNNIIQGG